MRQQYKDIEYELKRSRRKTASIYIERDGGVAVHVPQQLSETDLEALIENKRRWIYKNKAEWETLNDSRVQREYVNGEGFLYLGRSYRLKIVESQASPLKLKNGYFALRADCKERAVADDAFKAFYREKGKQRIGDRVEYFAPKLGVEPKSVRVLELQHRWGSCSASHSLSFHWKCMMSPLTVLDYVVVHELAHIIHPNHSKTFWWEVEKVLPDYGDRLAWLREHGAAMDL